MDLLCSSGLIKTSVYPLNLLLRQGSCYTNIYRDYKRMHLKRSHLWRKERGKRRGSAGGPWMVPAPTGEDTCTGYTRKIRHFVPLLRGEIMGEIQQEASHSS